MEDTTFLEGANLAGITTLMNNLHINEQANLEELENRSWASNKVFLPIILMKSLMDWQSHWALTLMTLNFRLTPHTVLYLKNPRVGAAIRYTAAYAAIAYVLTAYVVIVYVAAAYAAAAYAAAVYAMAVYAAAVCAMAVYAMAVCAAVRRAEALHATVVHVMTAVILFLRIEKICRV